MNSLRHTARALTALHAVARWHLGDAAAELSGALDQQALKQSRVKQIEHQLCAISATYSARVQTDRILPVAQLGLLSRQAHATVDLRTLAQADLEQTDAAVDQSRRTLEAHQLRLRSIEQARDDVQRRERLQQLSRQFAELDDLYLMTRTHLSHRMESES